LHEEVLSNPRKPRHELRRDLAHDDDGLSLPPKPVSAIARELGVTHVLEGSCGVKATTCASRCSSSTHAGDTHIWSRNYDRKLTSAMTLQSQVAQEVASQLAVKLSCD